MASHSQELRQEIVKLVNKSGPNARLSSSDIVKQVGHKSASPLLSGLYYERLINRTGRGTSTSPYLYYEGRPTAAEVEAAKEHAKNARAVSMPTDTRRREEKLAEKKKAVSAPKHPITIYMTIKIPALHATVQGDCVVMDLEPSFALELKEVLDRYLDGVTQ